MLCLYTFPRTIIMASGAIKVVKTLIDTSSVIISHQRTSFFKRLLTHTKMMEHKVKSQCTPTTTPVFWMPTVNRRLSWPKNDAMIITTKQFFQNLISVSLRRILASLGSFCSSSWMLVWRRNLEKQFLILAISFVQHPYRGISMLGGFWMMRWMSETS